MPNDTMSSFKIEATIEKQQIFIVDARTLHEAEQLVKFRINYNSRQNDLKSITLKELKE